MASTKIVAWEDGYGNGSRGNPGRDSSGCGAKRHFSGEDERAPARFRSVGYFGPVLKANEERGTGPLTQDQVRSVEEAKVIRSLILDTNVLIASLVRSEGITRASLTILIHHENCRVLAQADLVEELKKHSQEICNKAGLTRPLLEDMLAQLLENIDLAPVSLYENKLREALQFVRDDSDAPFAALALRRTPSTIITYNKRRFMLRRLLRGQVQVRTPVEVVRELD